MLLGAITIIVAVIAGIAMANKHGEKPMSRGANNTVITVLVIIGAIILAGVFLLQYVIPPYGRI